MVIGLLGGKKNSRGKCMQRMARLVIPVHREQHCTASPAPPAEPELPQPLCRGLGGNIHTGAPHNQC